MNWERAISCVLVLSMILGCFSLLTNDAEAGLDYITDLGSPQATYRGADWHRNGEFMIAVGNDSSNNGIVDKYNPDDGSWTNLATTAGDRYNAVSNVEAFTWYDNMEYGINGWTTNSWYTTETLVGYTLITDVWDLQSINIDLTGKYVLACDIDASITAGWNGGDGFDPLGDALTKFEGAGHQITNLYINRPATNNVGLFGYTETTSSIANVSLRNMDITGAVSTGGLVGYNLGFINSSSTTGTVQANGANCGGLIGQSQGIVNECYSTAMIVGPQNVGGLIGYCNGDITNSYATGDVQGVSTVAGGLAGYLWTNNIYNSYATGQVTCPDKSGGLVGIAASSNLFYSYSTGLIIASTSFGGLVGDNSASTATDCFWDTMSSGMPTSPLGTGKNTPEMMTQVTFTNWDFAGIWTIDEGLSYPYLEIKVDLFAQWVQGNPSTVPDAGSGTSHGAAQSGSNIWWFGRHTTGNYDDGTRVAGSLISPLVDLPGISSMAAVIFSHWFDVESGGNYDSMTVSIKNSSESSWYELKRWDSSDTPVSQWNQEIIMLYGWQGETVQLNFTFDSQDASSNDFAGWHIDDVLFYTNDVYIVVGEPNGGYSAYATDGYSTFVDMGVNSFDFNDVAAGSIGHSFMAVGDGGNVQYYDGVNWNTIFGAKPDDTLTGVTFNGTHWFIVGYNSTGSGKAYYFTQAEFHNYGRVILHPIWDAPDWRFNDIAWSNTHPSHKQRPGLGAVVADGSIMSLGDPEIWTKEFPASGHPPARLGADMTYVLTSGATLMFGGTNTAHSNETWLHSTPTNSWYNFTPIVSPPPRYGCEVVYDHELNATILFGGFNASTYMDDTWIYWVDNNTWLELNPGNSPPGRYRHEMVYDEVNNRTIMFGGETSGGIIDDTWEFSGGTWTEITPAGSPPARMAHAMTYNSDKQQVVLFGGDDGNFRNDTWAFNVTSGQWNNITPEVSVSPSPPVRYRHEIVYDRYNGYVILFGGSNGGGFLGDTWVYVPAKGKWFNLYPNHHPSARRDFGFVYDFSDGEPKLFGGMDGAAISDTWQCSFHTPWGGDVVNESIGTNSENLTAIAFDSAGEDAVFVGHNGSHGVVYYYNFNTGNVAIAPDPGNQFSNHKFYDVGYIPNSPTEEVIILGQSAFQFLPNMADTSTTIYAYSDYPHILDIDFQVQSTGVSKLNQQVTIDNTYTFYVEANYTVGGFERWSDASINITAWYDEGNIGT